jgi:hypothetical protein
MLSHETAPYTTDAEQNTLNNTANQQAANLINGCFTAQSAGERREKRGSHTRATQQRPSHPPKITYSPWPLPTHLASSTRLRRSAVSRLSASVSPSQHACGKLRCAGPVLIAPHLR